MVYDVITDSEAEKMKEMAKPQVSSFSHTQNAIENFIKACKHMLLPLVKDKRVDKIITSIWTFFMTFT